MVQNRRSNDGTAMELCVLHNEAENRNETVIVDDDVPVHSMIIIIISFKYIFLYL